MSSSLFLRKMRERKVQKSARLSQQVSAHGGKSPKRLFFTCCYGGLADVSYIARGFYTRIFGATDVASSSSKVERTVCAQALKFVQS
jgi:hypothetical protein